MKPNNRALQTVGNSWCPRGSGQVPRWVEGAAHQRRDSQQPSEYWNPHATDKGSKTERRGHFPKITHQGNSKTRSRTQAVCKPNTVQASSPQVYAEALSPHTLPCPGPQLSQDVDRFPREAGKRGQWPATPLPPQAAKFFLLLTRPGAARKRTGSKDNF